MTKNLTATFNRIDEQYDWTKWLSIVTHLRNKTCFPCLHSLVKTKANVWENARADQWKPKTQSPAREFSQTLLRSTGYGGTDNMCYFFYKIIIFIVNKEKDDIQSVYCKFSQLGDSQTTLLTPFSCFIALWKHTCRPIKTHVPSKLIYLLHEVIPMLVNIKLAKVKCLMFVQSIAYLYASM